MISEPGTFVGEWQGDLAGMTNLACQLRFMVGISAGAPTVVAFLQSSLDQGSTAYDVAVVEFAAVSRPVALSVLQGTSVPTDEQEAGPEAEGIAMPILGDRLRLKLVVTGNYTNTTLSARFIPA
jgi:hypothetical protein